MSKHHAVAIVSGLALGAFLGYEFASNLTAYPPYSWIGSYLAGTGSSGS
jgi:ABC-type thiamin/hydroxymethylpyrimidine transport system permease subunit